MADFVNPGILGSLAAFRSAFDSPISRSRDPNCSGREKMLGEARSKELTRLTSSFVLRRTADLLRKFLPEKNELVVFCPLTTLQKTIYKAILRSKAVSNLVANSGTSSMGGIALSCLTKLKKVSNHPSLVFSDSKDGEKDVEDHDVLAHFPEDFDPIAAAIRPELSGKLLLLDQLVTAIVTKTSDKLVVVSNYTQTLDLLASVFSCRGIKSLRLDGSLKSTERTALVDRFNASYSTERIFLLSAQAGGVGLNLIGGNRLILFDCSWNPGIAAVQLLSSVLLTAVSAVDIQAMARIWRDGQKKPVWIYRLLSVGSIDEKMFQRQLRKQEARRV